jgi:hypothetical protein
MEAPAASPHRESPVFPPQGYHARMNAKRQTSTNHARRRLLRLLGLAGLSALARAAHAGNHAGASHGLPLVVVELFTSQGCSACPPADALLRELARRPDVLALTYNVDYWDYLGWRDTLGSPDFTRRQRRYAAWRRDSRVYTPQMIINGRHHVIGNRREEVMRLIARERQAGDCRRVSMSLARRGDLLLVRAGPQPDKLDIHDATLWVITAIPEVTVTIERGENRGRTLTYANVVRKIVPAGMWHGRPLELPLPAEELFVDGASMCAALLQVEDHGPIIGAARLDM